MKENTSNEVVIRHIKEKSWRGNSINKDKEVKNTMTMKKFVTKEKV